MRKGLMLVGAGGFGREVLWWIRTQYNNEFGRIGFVDNAPELAKQEIDCVPVVGDDDWLANYRHEVNAVIAIANPGIRENVYNKLKENPLISFPSIIAGDAKIADSASIGKGCIVGFSSIVSINAALSDFVVVNPHSSIAHDTKVGSFSTLYYNVNLAGNVCIRSHVEIGSSATVIQGKTIGEQSVIGSGSVVIRDIPPNCIAVGMPANPIKIKT